MCLNKLFRNGKHETTMQIRFWVFGEPSLQQRIIGITHRMLWILHMDLDEMFEL